ncbi:hypothetical protein [Priestia megaterium]|uniref:hypothetical protein n=1 Tax=Priestia megaterium TaxID=1404 RepID=UPI00159680B1|nr:hypothetical protein [Priestia megaterium]
MKENKLKMFSIVHDKQSILLETSHTKFYSLERFNDTYFKRIHQEGQTGYAT